MSTSPLSLVADEQDTIFRAIAADDDETLATLAQHHAGQGNDEYAEWLRTQARKARSNNWAYDEAVDNELTN